MKVYIQGKPIRLDPRRAIGKGGEADVYALPQGLAVKVWKGPDHPDLAGFPQDQQAARQRIKINQQKLRHFPTGLPSRVVAPQELATDRNGQRVYGYTMRLLANAEPLLRYGERAYRSRGVGNDEVCRVFRDLHRTVTDLHTHQIVIGDFNDLNVLVQNGEAYLIDTDSFQYGRFACGVFTVRFVDPLLCDPRQTQPMLCRPHTVESDWYAFAVMLMQSLLFVGPYGGVYRPQSSRRRIPQDARPLHRITIFHPDVRYPKPAVSYGVLPDELLHYFQQTFQEDRRGAFPLQLLDALKWNTCASCGLEHARMRCPVCAKLVALPEPIPVRGTVRARQVLETRGTILAAAVQGGQCRWLVYEAGRFVREDGRVIFEGQLEPQMHFRLRGPETLVAGRDQLLRVAPGGELSRQAIDAAASGPAVDANAKTCFWIQNGRLLRDGEFAAELVGDVLSGQTRFWVGDEFGFGFYRAGELSVAFVFDAARAGIDDTVALPPLRGQLLDAACVFAANRCWLFTATQEAERTMHRCFLIQRDGSVVATAEAHAEEEGWLSYIHGKCAVGRVLLAATDEGIVRVEADSGQITKTKSFPDTKHFVDAESHLLPGPGGLYLVGRDRIQLLTISDTSSATATSSP